MRTTRSLVTPGTAAWIDLTTADLERSTAFYTTTFGWDATICLDDHGWQYDVLLTDADGPVSGISTVGPGDVVGPGWTGYVATADLAATTRLATVAGAEVLLAPVSLGDAGRLGVFLAPDGTRVAVWEPGPGTSPEVASVAQTVGHEVRTADLPAARRFGDLVFGWEFETEPATHRAAPLHASVAGRRTALLLDALAGPVGAAGWRVRFDVADLDGVLGRAVAAGGRLLTPPPGSTDDGTVLVMDPLEAVFGVRQAQLGPG